MKTAKIDPTLPFTSIEIDGETYKMCFDHGALAVAEEALMERGFDANLMFRCPPFTFSSIRILFAASLLAYQPDTDFEKAKSLITFRNKAQVMAGVIAAWNISVPVPESGAEDGPDPQ